MLLLHGPNNWLLCTVVHYYVNFYRNVSSGKSETGNDKKAAFDYKNKWFLWQLTLCPFSPGSPGSPSKPLSPCRGTQWRCHRATNITTNQSRYGLLNVCSNASWKRHTIGTCHMKIKVLVMAPGTLEPDSPGIPRAPSAPARPLEKKKHTCGWARTNCSS